MRNVLGLCVLSGLSALMLGGCVGAPESGEEGNTVQAQAPTGRGVGTLDSFTIENYTSPDGQGQPSGQGKPGGGNGITLHNGPVMTGCITVYPIWYGTNNAGSYQSLVSTFIGSLGGSPYYNINTTYYNSANVHVSNCINVGAATTVSGYPQGTSLSDAQIQQVVANQNPTDTNGIYLVLTDSTVTASSGFCTQYCGWHTHGTLGGKDIKYAFIGNPVRCPSACAAQSPGPNSNVGADGAVSIIAHEIEEAASDPDLNAWYDTRGYENADKCAWNFGAVSGPAGGQYNMSLGGKNWLIQQNWKNASGGACALSY